MASSKSLARLHPFVGLGLGVVTAYFGTDSTSKVVLGLVGGVSTELLGGFTGRVLDGVRERLQSGGRTNHDIALALRDTFLSALDGLQRAWRDDTSFASLPSDAQKQSLFVLDRYCEDLRQLAKLGIDSGALIEEAEVEQLRVGDSTFAGRLVGRLGGNVLQPVPALQAFVAEWLPAAWRLHFLQCLKDPDNTKAWRAWQLLLNDGLRTSLDELRRDVTASVDRLEQDVSNLATALDLAVSRLDEIHDVLQRASADERNAWAEELLDALHAEVRARFDRLELRFDRVDAGFGQITHALVRAEAKQDRSQETLDQVLRHVEALGSSTPAPGPEVVDNLPRPSQIPFIGRFVETTRLEGLLTHAEGSRTALIVGRLGVGKTALAQHMARTLSADFPDGRIWLEVGQLSKTDVLAAIARLLRVVEDEEGDLGVACLKALRKRRVLVILDRVIGDAVRDLVVDVSPSAIVVVTNDGRLGNLLQIEEARQIRLDPLAPAEGLDMFREILGGERVENELLAARDVVGKLGGLPIAITVVGARMKLRPEFTFREYLAWLSDPAADTAPLRLQNSVELDVERSIAWALAALNPNEQELWARLSVYGERSFSWRAGLAFRPASRPVLPAAPASYEGTRRVQDQLRLSDPERHALRRATETSVATEHFIRDTLDYLRNLYLLEPADSTAGERYRFHSVLLPFARQIAGDQGVVEDSALAQYRYFAARLLGTEPSDRSATSSLVGDLDDLWLIVDRMAEGAIVFDPRFAFALERFLEEEGQHHLGAQLAQKMADAAAALGAAREQFEFTMKLSRYARQRGRPRDALTHLDVCRHLIDRITDPTATLLCRCILAVQRATLLRRRREPDATAECLAAHEEALALAHEIGAPSQIRFARVAYVDGLATFGRIDDAIREVDAVIVEAADDQDHETIVKALSSRARLLLRRARTQPDTAVDLAAARADLERAAELSRQHLGSRSLARSLFELGRSSLVLGETARATEALREATNLEEHFDDRFRLAKTLALLAQSEQQGEELDAAKEHYQRAISLFLSIGDRIGYERALRGLRDLLRSARADAPQAEIDQVLSRDVLWTLQDIHEPEDLQSAVVTMGLERPLGGMIKPNVDDAQCFLARLEENAPPVIRAGAHAALARALMSTGDTAGAEHEWRTAIGFELESGDASGVGSMQVGLGVTLLLQGRPRESLECCEQAAESLGDGDQLDAVAVLARTLVQAQRAAGEVVPTARIIVDVAERVRRGRATPLGKANALSALGRAVFSIPKHGPLLAARLFGRAIDFAREAGSGPTPAYALAQNLCLFIQACTLAGKVEIAQLGGEALSDSFARIPDTLLAVRAHRTLGFLALSLKQSEVAEREWTRGRELADRAGFESEVVRFDLPLLLLQVRQGVSAVDRHLLDRVLARAEQQGDGRTKLAALPMLSVCHLHEGRVPEAKESLGRARDLAVALGNQRALAQVLTRLASIHVREGELDVGSAYLEEAAAIEESSGTEHGMARVMASRAALQMRAQRYDEAIRTLEPVLELERRLQNDRGVAITLHNLGRAHAYLRRPTALPLLEESLAIGRRLDLLRHQAIVLDSIALFLQHGGNAAAALDRRRESIALGERVGDKFHLCGAYLGFLRNLVAVERYDEVKGTLDRLLALMREVDAGRRNAGIIGDEIFPALLAAGHETLVADYLAPVEEIARRSFNVLAPWVSGFVKRLTADRNGRRIGFISLDDGRDVFFLMDWVPAAVAPALVVGRPIEVQPTTNEKGQHQTRRFRIPAASPSA